MSTATEDRIDIRSRIVRDFSYHAPLTAEVVDRHERVRSICRTAALQLAETVPPGRELSQAVSKLEEAMMHGNAGIARNPTGELIG